MMTGQPWSVKGIDPKAREAAKDLARRSGMTLGEWLNQVILEDGLSDDPVMPPEASVNRRSALARAPFRRAEPAPHTRDEILRVSETLDTLASRIEAAESRTAQVVGGVDKSVTALVARLDGAEQDSANTAARFEDVAEELRADQARLHERLQGADPGSAEAETREVLSALRGDLDGVVSRLEAIPEDNAVMVESVIARIAERLEQAEARTTDALQGLESSFGQLERRLGAAETKLADQPAGLEQIAANLSAGVEAARAEMAENIKMATDGRFDRMERSLQEMTGHVQAAERRSADALERMGFEVLRVAEALGRKVNEVERRSTDAMEQVGGDVARIADTMEARFNNADAVGAQALEKLGGEIARITERLVDRIANAERRSAQAIDEVGDQVVRVTERMQERQERASTDLADRIRQSEERTARLLEDARARIDQRLVETQGRMAREEAFSSALTAVLEEPELSPFGLRGPSAPELTLTTPAFEESRFEEPRFEESRFEEPVFGRARFEAPGLDEADFEEPAAARPAEVHDDLSAPAPMNFVANRFEEPGPILFRPNSLEEPAALSFADEAEALEADEPEALAEDPYNSFSPASFVAARGENPSFGLGLFADEADEDQESILEAESADTWRTKFADAEPFEDEPAPLAAGFAEFEEPEIEQTFDADHGHVPHTEAPVLQSSLDNPLPFGQAAAEEPAARSRNLSTRDLIEQARAAARAAAVAADPKARKAAARNAAGTGGLSLPFGIAKKPKRRQNSALVAAFMVSGAAAVAGVGAAGYILLDGHPAGVLPARVASALGLQPASNPTHLAAVAPHTAQVDPMAAVALTAQPSDDAAGAPIAAAAAPGATDTGAELYGDAVRRIEARDFSGLDALRKSANLGYAPAEFYLAKLFETGEGGAKKDLGEARRWTQRAAEAGDRKAMHNLALYYVEGSGGPKNTTTAAQWFRRAADLGLVDSQYNLGRLYEEGFGVSQNPAEAYKWYLIAAHAGDTESRASAQRLKGQLSAEAQAAAERAAGAFQAQQARPAATQLAQATTGGDVAGAAIAQRALSRLGYYQGPTDGSPSPALKGAIAAYQRDQGLPATGVPDSTLSQRLAVIAQ